MSHPRDHRRAALSALAATALALVLSTVSVAAHDHVVNDGTDQETELANGQNHPVPFREDTTTGLWMSCASAGWTLPASFGPAWYGLETAHHGPDSGDPGKDDSCYAADANPAPAVDGDDQNPAID